jgi:hypothetical protein
MSSLGRYPVAFSSAGLAAENGSVGLANGTVYDAWEEDDANKSITGLRYEHRGEYLMASISRSCCPASLSVSYLFN